MVIKGGTSFTEKHSRCNSVSSSSNSRARRCRCGEKLLLLTSKRAKEPKTTFLEMCNTHMSCNYFQGADHEELSEGKFTRIYNAMEEMKMKNAKLSAKLVAERTYGRMKNCLVISS
ncbi:hypothetical protein SESBI_34806 [Sesbania bispinosa]|nr:hypothetical protein SESBI_34806 [Sesbania bispinosa]